MASGPDAASWGPGRTDVVVRGTDGNLWHRSNSGARAAWDSLGAPTGGFGSDPAAVSSSVNSLDVFVRGTLGDLWHRSYA